MYIAGTSGLNDVWDDLKIPFNLTSQSKRYVDAEKLLNLYPYTKGIVGHSLGGVVALELQKNYPEKQFMVNTYGAPVISINGADNNRHRNYLDPISIFDRGANSNLHIGINPHTYNNFYKNIVLDKPYVTNVYRTDH